MSCKKCDEMVSVIREFDMTDAEVQALEEGTLKVLSFGVDLRMARKIRKVLTLWDR